MWPLSRSLKERCHWNGNNCLKFLRMRKREWVEGSSCFCWLSGWFQMANYLGKYLPSKWPYSTCSGYVSTLLTVQDMLSIIKGHKTCYQTPAIYWSSRMQFEKKASEETDIPHQRAEIPREERVSADCGVWAKVADFYLGVDKLYMLYYCRDQINNRGA